MTSAYWSQWDHSEIMSMHGVELDDCQNDNQEDCRDDNESKVEEECYSASMDSLGLSWRDFI